MADPLPREAWSVQGSDTLRAVIQHNKSKVRPVLDYRELNQYIEAYTADADVCGNGTRRAPMYQY